LGEFGRPQVYTTLLVAAEKGGKIEKFCPPLLLAYKVGCFSVVLEQW